MRKRAFIFALLFLGAALIIVTLVRGMGVSARRQPTSLETTVAKGAWRFLVPTDAAGQRNPVPASADVIRGAMEHWADHCASCHGNDGSGDTRIGRNLHPPAPDMRETRTQRLSDGELFYAIEQGIPFTGMPAWSTGTDAGAEASWELVHFVRYLTKLTAEEITHMETLNPRSAGEERRRHDVDDFLKGKGK